MNKAKIEFAQRLLAALEQAGVPAKPAVVEREFNQRYWGKPITLYGVRLWLRGETIPSHDKVLCLAEWLGVEPATLRYGDEVPKAARERGKRWDEGIGYQEREIFEFIPQAAGAAAQGGARGHRRASASVWGAAAGWKRLTPREMAGKEAKFELTEWPQIHGLSNLSTMESGFCRQSSTATTVTRSSFRS
jgi:hypothetical protein